LIIHFYYQKIFRGVRQTKGVPTGLDF